MTDPLYERVQILVEATSFESQQCWEDYHERIEWASHREGRNVYVGSIGGKPIRMNLDFSTIGGVLVCFWDPCSVAIDHDQIKRWFEENCPQVRLDRRCCNPTNFHIVVGHIKNIQAKRMPVAQ